MEKNLYEIPQTSYEGMRNIKMLKHVEQWMDNGTLIYKLLSRGKLQEILNQDSDNNW